MLYEKIKGFNELTKVQQMRFTQIFQKHQNAMGTEARKKYIPKRVKQEKGYIRVDFSNGKWLHYTDNYTWY
jgi:hypothetical protein